MSSLRKGWVRVLVEQLAADEPASLTDGPFGSNLKTSHYTQEGPRVIRLQNIGDGVFNDERAHISEEHFNRLRKHEAAAGDVVIAMLGEKLPRACIVPPGVGPAIVKADCVRLRVHAGLSSAPFVAYALNSQQLRSQATALVHGVGRPRLGLKWFRSLEVPLAPRPEQRRIVDAIESYFTRLDDAVATLERVQRNLKRYRASVLKAAVEGRLVPTEAELARAEGRDYEPASVLLERILSERRDRWEEAELAKMKAKGQPPKNDKWKAKYKEPSSPDHEELPALPEGWSWSTWDQVAERVTVGHVGKMKDQYRPKGVPFLRGGNVRANRYEPSGLKHVSREFHEQLSKSSLAPGDVLIVRSGAVGTACVVPETLQEANCSDLVIVKRPTGVRPRFGAYYMNSLAQATVRSQQVGVALIHFNTKSAAALSIPVPPEAEQDRVVTEVEKTLSVIDELESEVALSLKRTARLRQGVLKWAFEGKLVDQDPADEPAKALLERIMGDLEASADKKPKTRARRKARSRKT